MKITPSGDVWNFAEYVPSWLECWRDRSTTKQFALRGGVRKIRLVVDKTIAFFRVKIIGKGRQ